MKQAMEIGSVQEFYESLAGAYSILSNDRAFDAQVDAISAWQCTRSIPCFCLELCAGPAEHSRSFARRHNADVWALDASTEMRAVALANGFPKAEQYVTAMLPSLGSLARQQGTFDIITLLRYSIGYIDRTSIDTLLSNVLSMLKPGGIFVVELHDFLGLIDNLADMSIRERTAHLDQDAFIHCVWPSAEIRWSAYDLVASIPLTLTITKRDSGPPHVISLVSTETIYLVEELRRLTKRFSEITFRLTDAGSSKVFPDGLVVVLEKGLDV